MKLNNLQMAALVAVAILAIVGAIVVVSKNSLPPEPTLGPGQTLKNPFGTAGAPGPGRGGPGRPGPGDDGPGQNPAARQIPQPGTVDPQRGMGPSKNAPIPGMR